LLFSVIPAKAGIQLCIFMRGQRSVIPAFAGMTQGRFISPDQKLEHDPQKCFPLLRIML
jgi:hypothetical protein